MKTPVNSLTSVRARNLNAPQLFPGSVALHENANDALAFVDCVKEKGRHRGVFSNIRDFEILKFPLSLAALLCMITI